MTQPVKSPDNFGMFVKTVSDFDIPPPLNAAKGMGDLTRLLLLLCRTNLPRAAV